MLRPKSSVSPSTQVCSPCCWEPRSSSSLRTCLDGEARQWRQLSQSAYTAAGSCGFSPCCLPIQIELNSVLPHSVARLLQIGRFLGHASCSVFLVLVNKTISMSFPYVSSPARRYQEIRHVLGAIAKPRAGLDSCCSAEHGDHSVLLHSAFHWQGAGPPCAQSVAIAWPLVEDTVSGRGASPPATEVSGPKRSDSTGTSVCIEMSIALWRNLRHMLDECRTFCSRLVPKRPERHSRTT